MTAPAQRILLCLSCGNETPHSLLGSHHEFAHSGHDSAHVGTILFVSCGTCEEAALLFTPSDEVSYRTLWPHAGLDDTVPAAVSAYYEGAQKVKRRVPSAFAVQLRRALEAICEDHDLPHKTLAVNLEALVNQLELPAIAAEMATVSRLLGNKGAHAGPDVTTKEAETLDEFFLALVEYVYIAPAKLKKYQDALAEM